MKYRIIITMTVLLALLLSAIPVRAAAMTPDVRNSTQIPATFNRSLADIINNLPDGHHDNFAGLQSPFFCRAEGWAADPDDRSLHLNIRILSDGAEVAQTPADTFRPDLADAGVCTGGTCSFSVNLWGLISPDVDHVITVQAQDAQTGEWSNLYDTPKTLNCFTAHAGAFMVNSTADGADADPGNGVCETFTPGECTLRAAMMESNANPGVDTINFAIPGDGPYTISPTYELPAMGDAFILDGTTQPGYDHTPIVELNGSSAGPDVDGLDISAGSSVIRGLVINRFSRDGMVIYINGGNVIQGNYIGTDITGTVNLGNSRFAVFVRSSPNNLIGGTAAGQGNLILGSGNHALQIADSGADGNVVQGNFIGTDVTGTFALGNPYIGVVIGTGATNNLIGGAAVGARNVISGNAQAGVVIFAAGTTGNQIQGNYIGTDASGTAALANGAGVFISNEAANNTIGGSGTGEGNVISGNTSEGVTIIDTGTSGNVVAGNFIGTDGNGTTVLANNGKGVAIFTGATNNLIGGTSSQARNIISGNRDNGVVLYGNGVSNNTVQGNYIGTDVSGTLALGNTPDGVMIAGGASDNLIGGTTVQARNIIAGNGQNGIGIYDAGTTRNIVQGNFIGTDITGTIQLGNSSDGIAVAGGSDGNLIGGMTTGAGNIISGNSQNGIGVWDAGSTGNTIQGNLIGTDVSGASSLGNADDGVLVLAPNNTIGGTTPAARNIISGNQEQGLRFWGSAATGNTVEGNFIGTDITGSVALGNGTDCCHSGVVIHGGASNNTIGGNVPGVRNVISGNTADGVTIIDSGTAGNVVAGNFIGTDLNGVSGIPNAASGVAIYSGATNNLVGGTNTSARNLISGNGGPGVNICCDGATRNLVKGNFIGTDVSGKFALGNAGDGVSIYQSAVNTIGGVEAGARNLISGNHTNGIGIYDAGTTGNLVQGNYVGTDVTGMSAIGNSWDGVVICCGGASENTVGGTALGAGNLISGNGGGGIGIYDDTRANVVQGNLIGTDAMGTGSLGNGANGIGIAGGATNNTIGGTLNGARNTIAFNGANGVSLTADAGTGNIISSNSIYSNGGLGIDLGENGVTLNDFFDADSGPNNLQNFPVIIMVKNTSQGIMIQGVLFSTANTDFRLQFFSNNACDSSGYGEGQSYLGFAQVRTNATGHVNFKITLRASPAAGNFITATATDSANNTSEFSNCTVVSP